MQSQWLCPLAHKHGQDTTQWNFDLYPSCQIWTWSIIWVANYKFFKNSTQNFDAKISKLWEYDLDAIRLVRDIAERNFGPISGGPR